MAIKTRKGVPDASPGGDPAQVQRPKSDAEALRWVEDYTGVRIASRHVCRDHHSPADYFCKLLKRPPLALVLGPRGGGKSFLSALDTHFTSRWRAKHRTRILGGSLAQSEQIYDALREAVYDGEGAKGSDRDAIAKLMNGRALYHNGSDVAILAASSTSVRGPHAPSLKLDEVDEIEPDLREAAMGMCMNRHGSKASVVMTSTWHRRNGPMGELMGRADAGEFPLYKFCSFEILKRCSRKRSGAWVGGDAGYENCPQCPLKPWCHAERDRNGDRMLAKLSDGHYSIDSLIQKVHAVSARTFESDYLCMGPRTEGLWFPTFDKDTHVSERAEFDSKLDHYVSIDSGVFTGAVFFQVVDVSAGVGTVEEVRVFADYLNEGETAENNARAIVELTRSVSRGRLGKVSTDPAGGSRNPVGPTVIGEYQRVGLQPLERWPTGSVADGLALVESFVNPADGRSRLLIHPRCKHTINAFQNYRRAKCGGQLQDYPADPQHPYEELVDALRGGLRVHFPDGRGPKPNLTRVSANRVI